MPRPKLLKEQKPLTEKQKQELNMVAKYLASQWVTKYQVADLVKTSERTARDMISTIAKKVPVISLSSGKGYKRAKTKDDLDLAIQSANELRSRISELNQRLKPLDEFINYHAIKENM